MNTAGVAMFTVALVAHGALAADVIVSAQDGKFVRVEGRATYPQPAPPDSLVVIDASQFPPKVTGTLEGIEQTVQGPPQAVAVTPDGKLAIVGAPTRATAIASYRHGWYFMIVAAVLGSLFMLAARLAPTAQPAPATGRAGDKSADRGANGEHAIA